MRIEATPRQQTTYFLLLLDESLGDGLLLFLLLLCNHALDVVGSLDQLRNKETVGVVNVRIEAAAQVHLLTQAISAKQKS